MRPTLGTTTLEWLAQFPLWSRERMAFASKSELRRWFQAGNVWINGEKAQAESAMQFPVESCVLFPKGNRITLR